MGILVPLFKGNIGDRSSKKNEMVHESTNGKREKSKTGIHASVFSTTQITTPCVCVRVGLYRLNPV